MKHNYPTKPLLSALVLLFAASACVDSAYDLGNVSLKITLGAGGITMPLGKVDSVSVDSLIRGNEIEENLSVEDGGYVYKRTDQIQEEIDAVKIDPITDVIPVIDPYIFRFTEGALPETVGVAGFSNKVQVDLPSFSFTDQPLISVDVSKPINIDDLDGQTLPDGMAIPTITMEDSELFDLEFDNIPDEIASLSRLYFSGAPQGTPMQVKFSAGSLGQSVRNGKLSLSIKLPAKYTLHDGHSVVGNAITITNHNMTGNSAEFFFYIVERSVTESITAGRTLTLPDQIEYSISYSGLSNGTPVATTVDPLFSFSIQPQVNDADLTTNQITPEPTSSVTDVSFEVDGLDDISKVNYIAFTNNSSNALVLRASNAAMPLRGQIPVQITFPDIYEFASGIVGLSGRVFNTTFDKLSSGVRLPLTGVRLTGNDALVTNGKLSVQKNIATLISPDFPGGNYTLSELTSDSKVEIDVVAPDMNLYIDASECQITAGFSKQIEIAQDIDETFDVPDEVAHISLAQVADASYYGEAGITINLDLKNSPVDRCNFDDISITLPKFIVSSYPGIDANNTIHIKRVTYTGYPIKIAFIPVKAIKDVKVSAMGTGKKANLAGRIQLNATVNVPDDSVIDGLDKTEISVIPQVTLSPLRVTEVVGKVDIDLQKYLKPTTIDLKDIRESLGDENIEINLVAPRIYLTVLNPVGVTMKGDITLQPYDFADQKLAPIVIKGIVIQPADGAEVLATKLFVSDALQAPEGYTLCRVPDLSKLVQTIPSKIDITFGLKVDDTKEQHIVLTGKPYPFNVDYSFDIPLKFMDNARIQYAGKNDVSEAFEKLEDYEITIEDILISVNTISTLPLDLDVNMEFLDKEEKSIEGVSAVVLDKISGYNAQTDGDYKKNKVNIQFNLKDGNIQMLKNIKWIKYAIEGEAQGTGAGLSPSQYIKADLTLILKKGISIDLD